LYRPSLYADHSDGSPFFSFWPFSLPLTLFLFDFVFTDSQKFWLYGSGASQYYLTDITALLSDGGVDNVFINGTDGKDEFLFRSDFIALIHSPTAWEQVHISGLTGKVTVYLYINSKKKESKMKDSKAR
jgi:hypothetical protein